MKVQKLIVGLGIALALLFLASCAKENISVSKIIDKVNDHLKSELQLTPDQNQKLLDFTDTIKKQLAENESKNKAGNADFIAMIEEPKLDQAKIRQMVKSHAEDSAKNADAWLDTYLPKLAAFHDSLTAEQLKKAASYIQGWMDRVKT